MTRVLINFCSIEELMSLPGVGAKGADNILEMREAKGDLELEDLRHVPYLRLTPQYKLVISKSANYYAIFRTNSTFLPCIE